MPASERSRLQRPRTVAVIGAGWSGLAAAVDLLDAGAAVRVFEMAPHVGGRARSALHDDVTYDNGQHIMIGAYRDTLALMRRAGVDVDAALLRMPLALVNARGQGLRLRAGHPVLAFLGGVARATHWPWRDRLALLAAAARWRLRGFSAPLGQTVSELTDALPRSIVRGLIDPLCVAALNTPASQASAVVFLRILKDALFAGPGASDLLLPRRALSDLWPVAAVQTLQNAGAEVRLRARVRNLEPHEGRWRLDGETFDAVVLACSSTEAARLTQAIDAAWSQQAAALTYQSIVTVYASHVEARLPSAMVALDSDAVRPAQFVFDQGTLLGREGHLTFVISGANAWLDRGLDATVAATLAQAREAFDRPWARELAAVHAVAEKRATFACTPDLVRPRPRITQGLWAAGDYVEGPYPATLEGSVRAGRRAGTGVMGESDADMQNTASHVAN